MKDKIANKLSFIGAGTGLALFAVFGLLPGAFLGGVLGLNMANFIFGPAVSPTLIPRIIIVIGMLTGVMVTGLMFTASGASLGWLIGLLWDSATKTGKEPASEELGNK